MKLLLSTFVVLFAGLPAMTAAEGEMLSPVQDSQAVSSASSRAEHSVQSGVQDFRAKFRTALDAQATKAMESLVRKRKDDAIQAIMTVCVAIAETPTKRFDEEIQALRKAWRATHNTDFADRQYEYFSLLNPSFKRTRRDLQNDYTRAYSSYELARKDKDAVRYAEVADKLTDIAKAFEQVGDNYLASLSWYFVASAVDTSARGEDAELFRACAAYIRSFETRDKAGLRDANYTWAKDRADDLLAAGYGDPEGAGRNPGKPGTPGVSAGPGAAEPAPPIILQPTFEIFEDLSAVRRPNFSLDDLYQVWQQIGLKEVGSTAKLATFEESPTFMRLGATKIGVDWDNDGEADAEVSMTGSVTPLQFTVGEGDNAREMALLLNVGLQDDTFHGFRQDLGPSDGYMGVFFAPAGSMVVDLAGTSLRIFDGNVDGIYGSLGEAVKSWQYAGCRKDSYQPDLDSIQIGNSKHAVPFSEMIQVDGNWYSLQVELNGNRISAQPVANVPTGTVKLKMKGVSADFLVLSGIGSLENLYFDVMANGAKGVEVPAGTYALFSGQVSKGKRQQTMKALILPGSGMNNFTVAEGETLTIEFGAPFGFDFGISQNDDTVTIDEDSVIITGKGGETYQRLWNCVPLVDVLVRQAGARKGVDVGTLRPSQSREEITANGWVSAWFPISRELDKGKMSGDEVEVQLFQKKNKLFGKIESAWL